MRRARCSPSLKRKRDPTGAVISTRPGVKINRDAVGEVPDQPDKARNQLAPQGGPSPG